jgi:hypothetical protein
MLTFSYSFLFLSSILFSSCCTVYKYLYSPEAVSSQSHSSSTRQAGPKNTVQPERPLGKQALSVPVHNNYRPTELPCKLILQMTPKSCRTNEKAGPQCCLTTRLTGHKSCYAIGKTGSKSCCATRKTGSQSCRALTDGAYELPCNQEDRPIEFQFKHKKPTSRVAVQT